MWADANSTPLTGGADGRVVRSQARTIATAPAAVAIEAGPFTPPVSEPAGTGMGPNATFAGAQISLELRASSQVIFLPV